MTAEIIVVVLELAEAVTCPSLKVINRVVIATTTFEVKVADFEVRVAVVDEGIDPEIKFEEAAAEGGIGLVLDEGRVERLGEGVLGVVWGFDAGVVAGVLGELTGVDVVSGGEGDGVLVAVRAGM